MSAHKLPSRLLVLALTLLQGVIWLHVTPPWDAPDEPGHFLYVQLFAELSRIPHKDDVTPERWQRLLDSLDEHDWQAYVHPGPDMTPLARDPTLLASGSQIGQKPPGYYALAAAWLRLLPQGPSRDAAAQLQWLRWLSLALHLLTTAVVLALAGRLWPDAPHRAVSMGLLAGLFPMVGFIGSSVNNDALTMLWGAVGFAGLLLARSRPAWALTLAWIALGQVGVDAGLLFLWPLALVRWLFFAPAAHGLQVRSRSELQGPLRMGLLLALVLIPILLLLPNPRWAAGWRRHDAPCSRADGRLYLDARETPALLNQTLSGLTILQRQGQPLTLDVEAAGQGVLVIRLVEEGGASEARCPLLPQPQTCRITHALSPEAGHVSVHLFLPTGQAHARAALSDAAGWSLLLNGEGAYPAPLGDPLFTWLEKRLPLPAGYFSRVLYGRVWDVPSLMRYAAYMAFAWASFWGWFGWLTRPFPWWVYLALAAATAAALWGLWQRMLHDFPSLRGSWPLAGLAVLLIGVQVFMPMLGQAWQPQGRYFFPALLPIVLLLTLGWETLLPHARRAWLPPILLLALTGLNLLAWALV